MNTSSTFGVLDMALSVSTRDKIIQLLSNSVSLSAKQIHMRLQREYALSNSYQATHKTLQQMAEERILDKSANLYLLNPGWVENFRKNAEQLSDRVKSGSKEFSLAELKENESVHLSFKGIIDVGWFIIDKLLNASNPRKKPGVALWRFCYSIIGLGEKHLAGLKSGLAKNEWYAFVEEKNEIDKMFGETLLSYGFKQINYGVSCATPLSDKMVIDDYIAEIIYPSAFRKIWAR